MFKNFLSQYQLLVLVILKSKQPMLFTEWSYHCLMKTVQFNENCANENCANHSTISKVSLRKKSWKGYQKWLQANWWCYEKITQVHKACLWEYKFHDRYKIPILIWYSNYHQVYLSTNHGSKTHQNQVTTFLSNQYHTFKTGFQINPDIPLLHTKVEKVYMYDFMVESSKKCIYSDEKGDHLKKSFLVRN